MNFPVFPLNGAILFPNTNLPLNIFEDKYIDMVDYALSHSRLIGMIQTKKNKDLFTIGCLGKITNFTETPDGRYQINLEGINRFKVKKIIDSKKKFIITYPKYQRTPHPRSNQSIWFIRAHCYYSISAYYFL